MPPIPTKYGTITPAAVDRSLVEVREVVEKLKQGTARSNLMTPSRYILQPEVMRILDNPVRGAGGEIQLADAMAQQPFHGYSFDGQRYDSGDKAGYVQANLARPDARVPRPCGGGERHDCPIGDPCPCRGGRLLDQAPAPLHVILTHRFWHPGTRAGQPNVAWLGTPWHRQRMVDDWDEVMDEPTIAGVLTN